MRIRHYRKYERELVLLDSYKANLTEVFLIKLVDKLLIELQEENKKLNGKRSIGRNTMKII